MELALQVIGGYMAFVLAFGWVRGWHCCPRSITKHAAPRRQVVWVNRNTFKVVR
jgi:hypothetical protein